MTLNDLLKKSLEVEREHRKLTSLPGQKLSTRAYIAAAMTHARCTNAELARLRKEFEDPDGLGLDAARFALRKMIVAVRSPNFPWPPSDPARLRHLVPDAAETQLANVKATPMLLFCLAVQTAGERYPESFGAVENHEDWKRRVEDLERERVDLYARISTAYTHDDVSIDDVDATGRARVTFRVSGGAVPIAPKENAGQRLTAWLLQNPAEEATIT